MEAKNHAAALDTVLRSDIDWDFDVAMDTVLCTDIFLGDFIFQNETLLQLPYENYERYGLGPNAHLADFNDCNPRKV